MTELKGPTVFGLLALACLAAPARGQAALKFPAKSPCRDVAVRYAGRDFSAWTQQLVDGQTYQASPALQAPEGGELSHHRLVVRYAGGGSVSVCIAGSPSNNLSTTAKSKRLCRRLGRARSGRQITFVPLYKGQRYAWVLLRATGGARITEVRHTALQGDGTLYGHIGRTFGFAGAKLPYRLMYPKGYNPRRKYPLVVSVAGSGGVGTDNTRNMEMVILGRYLFTHHYDHPRLACFSLVPQIPPRTSVPKGYWPSGTKGAPTRFHPDWPAVNETGWYVQATLALIQALKQAEGLSIDPDRVYYSGFSYGGKACWEFLKAGRETFAAAACGAGWPVGRCFSDPAGEYLEQLKREVRRYKHIPVYIFAGAKDRMRFGSAAVHREIRAAGGKSFYDEIPKANHVGSAGRGWTNARRLAWLFGQQRSRNPAPGPDPYPGGNYDGSAAPTSRPRE